MWEGTPSHHALLGGAGPIRRRTIAVHIMVMSMPPPLCSFRRIAFTWDLWPLEGYLGIALVLEKMKTSSLI